MSVKYRVAAFFFCWMAALLVVLPASGQTGSRPVRFGGSMGLYLENYNRSGEPGRRPPNTVRFYLQPTLSLFGLQTGLALNLLLSTEQQYVSQQLNTVGLAPSWSWGGLSLGDFYPTFSPYTLNGIRVRGAGLKLSPGLLRFSLAAGETQRASDLPGAEAYRRMLYAVRLGVGNAGGSYLDINLVKSEDLIRSLPDDSTLSVAPQENIVASIAGRLRLFRNRFQLSGEVAASGFTRDLRSALYEEEEIPAFVASVFQPRLSTRLGFAYAADARVELRSMSAGLGMQYIGPGYESHGIYSMFNDLKEVHSDATVRLLRNRLTLRSTYALQWDNLLKQKRFTTQRQRASLAINYLPTRHFNANFSSYMATMDNHATVDTLRTQFVSLSLTGSLHFIFSQQSTLRRIQLNTAYNVSNQKNRMAANPKLETYQVGTLVQLAVPAGLLFSPGISLIRTRSGQNGWRNILNFQSFLSRSRPGRLRPTLSAILSNGYGSASFRADLRIDYRLSSKGNLSFSVRMMKYEPPSDIMNPFREVITSLNYRQMF